MGPQRGGRLAANCTLMGPLGCVNLYVDGPSKGEAGWQSFSNDGPVLGVLSDLLKGGGECVPANADCERNMGPFKPNTNALKVSEAHLRLSI